MKQQLVDKSSRIEVVDPLRGFAVMAILLVHNLEHFIFPVYPENSPGWLNVLDQGVLNSIFALFAGKAYAIFALLFGFTFYMQSNNQKKQGISAIVFCGVWRYWVYLQHGMPPFFLPEMYCCCLLLSGLFYFLPGAGATGLLGSPQLSYSCSLSSGIIT